MLIDFEALDPERHLLKFDLGAELEVHGVPFGVQQQGLLGLVLADELEVEHAATVNAGSDQPRLLLIEVGKAYQSNFERDRLDVVQVLIEDVKLKVSRDC